MNTISTSQAAKLLGISIDNLGVLEKQGLIHASHTTQGESLYSSEEIVRIKSRRGLTLSEEAAQVGIGIQREMVYSVTFTRKVLLLAGGVLSGYVLLVAVFTTLFIVYPIQTAKWLGIVKNKTTVAPTQENRVLGTQTSLIQERNSPVQIVLQPIGNVSLGLVKNIHPNSYAQIAQVAILDTNDVLGLDASGAIIPERPISLAESSLLQIGSMGLVANLNSEFLQGRQPGSNPGDIAIVGETPATPATITNIAISGLTNDNFSGSAGITNSNLANPFITIGSSSPLSGGALLSLGGTLTLSCPTCVTSIAFTATSLDMLTNKTISGTTNTLSNIANSSLSNSALTFAGNTGSGSIALGDALTVSGGGINTAAFSAGTITVTGTEADSLQSVYNRGNTIPTTTGNTANTIDEATIAVGNIASTAQQNFATLNITNGGSGFLDIELIRGFINFQGMNTLYDDFTSKSLDTSDRWTANSTGGGSSCSILAGGVNGLLRMHSGGGANRGCELTTQAIGSLKDGYYQRGNNPIFETKLKIDTLTNARIFAGFTDVRIATTAETNPNTNHSYIAKKAADTTWQCVTDDGGATETTADTGVTIIANTFYRLRVELRSGTIPETICTIDDGTTVIRTVVTATQPSATSPMDVYIKLNQSNSVQKNMDVDYVRAWQDDFPAFALTADGNLAQALNTTDTESAFPEESPLPEIENPNEEIATDSANVTELVTNRMNDVFKNLIEFFGNVIFHGDVSFLGRPTFNKDTAGHALIKAGSNEVAVIFDKVYAQNPVVTASVNLADSTLMDAIPPYAIYDLSAKGFKIKLSKVTTFDVSFSWIALAAHEDVVSTSSVSTTPALLSPTPTLPIASEAQPETVVPNASPSSSQEIVPNPTASASASPTTNSLQ